MFRASSPSAAAARLTAAVVVLALGCQTAQAQVKPFKVKGGGPAPEGLSIFGADSPHSATGTATHLGRYSGDGVAKVLSFNPVTFGGTFEGTFTFVAANGDKLACTYGDTDNGAEQAGEFQVPAQSTGRFRDVVDGSFLMVAVTEPFPLMIDADGFTPPFDYAWVGEGWLKFRRR